MSHLNLHHLRYFLAIAQEGSLSGASKKLLIGQPALSAQLKQLEEWLGKQLFERVGKRLVLTQTGEYVLKYAKAIKSLEEELILNMAHTDQVLKKEFSLGALESVPKSTLAEAIAVINKVTPVRLKVIEGTGDELFELLSHGKIDFFIGNFKPRIEDREMYFVSLGKEDVSIWGSDQYLPLRKGFPKSLEGKPFILPGYQNPMRNDFERFMLQSGLGFQVAVEAQDKALHKELAVAGTGLILLGEESAKAWVKAGHLHRIGPTKDLKEEYWLGMVKKTIDNSYIKSIMSAFK
jgi:LysR family transcriptional activator of nhaA